MEVTLGLLLVLMITGMAPLTVSSLPSATLSVIFDLSRSFTRIPNFLQMSGPAQRVEHPVSAIPCVIAGASFLISLLSDFGCKSV